MSSYVDPSTATTQHLESLSNANPSLTTKYQKISTLFASKHWHQLTLELLSFLSSPEENLHPYGDDSGNSTNNSFYSIYKEVVLRCDIRINEQSLAKIIALVAKSLSLEDAMALLQDSLENKKDRIGVMAQIYLKSKLLLLKIQKVDSLMASSNEKEQEEAKIILKEILKSLDESKETLKGTEDEMSNASVYSAYYETAKAYRKLVGPPELFFRDAMSYLSYTPLSSLSDEETYKLAVDISLAALTGENVFNFGSVVNDNPILMKCLENSPEKWLMGLMEAMAKGDVRAFQKISQSHAQDIQKHPVLISRADSVQEKITLLALVNMVFERPSHDRTLKFTDIAEHILVDVDKVEWIIMRSLSLGLMKGSMDQVEGEVSVTWILPRILDEVQLGSLAKRFGEWAGKVATERKHMAEQTIFA